MQVSVASTGGSSSSGGSNSGGNHPSAGLLGLALEELELTLYTVLDFVETVVHLPHQGLDATINSLHDAINNDPLLSTSQGQMAVSLGQQAALQGLSDR